MLVNEIWKENKTFATQTYGFLINIFFTFFLMNNTFIKWNDKIEMGLFSYFIPLAFFIYIIPAILISLLPKIKKYKLNIVFVIVILLIFSTYGYSYKTILSYEKYWLYQRLLNIYTAIAIIACVCFGSKEKMDFIFNKKFIIVHILVSASITYIWSLVEPYSDDWQGFIILYWIIFAVFFFRKKIWSFIFLKGNKVLKKEISNEVADSAKEMISKVKNVEVKSTTKKTISKLKDIKLVNKKIEKTDISSLSKDLRELNKLKEDGILTEEEFNEQKKKLLKQ